MGKARGRGGGGRKTDRCILAAEQLALVKHPPVDLVACRLPHRLDHVPDLGLGLAIERLVAAGADVVPGEVRTGPIDRPEEDGEVEVDVLEPVRVRGDARDEAREVGRPEAGRLVEVVAADVRADAGVEACWTRHE